MASDSTTTSNPSLRTSSSRLPPSILVDDIDPADGSQPFEFPSRSDTSLLGPGADVYTMDDDEQTQTQAQAQFASAASPVTPNPFNFQTQVISTGPVKSVRPSPCASQNTG